MKKIVLAIVTSVVVLWSAIPASAEILPILRLSDFTGSAPYFSLIDGKFKVEARFKAGYQRLDARFNVPIAALLPIIGYGIGFPLPVDFKLKDANLWVGAAEFEIQFGEALGLFLNGEGSASRRVGVTMEQDPFGLPVEWTGSKLQWWSLEGGATYRVHSSYSLMAGLRRSKLSLDLRDPSDQAGFYQFWLRSGYQDMYTSDMDAKIWIPYFGVRVHGQGFKADLLYSPFAWADVTLPFRYRYDFAIPDFGGPFAFQQEKYSMKKSGNFFEASMDYEINPIGSIGLGLWAKGSYLCIKGKGFQDSARDAQIPLPGYTGTSSADASGSFTMYSASGGLAASLGF
jgi:hypothetical protein